ncbi:hypothetical protein AgCh_005464 [Apium graveolens]
MFELGSLMVGNGKAAVGIGRTRRALSAINQNFGGAAPYPSLNQNFSFSVDRSKSVSERYSPSGFFFGVSAIALAINMLFICKMVINGNGLDVDEYVRRSYKFAYSDCIEMGHVASLPEPPDPNELYPRQ